MYRLAQAAGEQPTIEEFAPMGLRSPEEILHSYFGPKIDIWAVGCLVGYLLNVPITRSCESVQTFEFLTGRWLFHPEEGETWSLDDDHLAKMLELTGEQFNDTMLNFSLRKEDFFDDDCMYSSHFRPPRSRAHSFTASHNNAVADSSLTHIR